MGELEAPELWESRGGGRGGLADQGPLHSGWAGRERRPGCCGSGGGAAKGRTLEEEQKPGDGIAQPALVTTSSKLPVGSEPQPGGLEASTEDTVKVGNECIHKRRNECPDPALPSLLPMGPLSGPQEERR